MSRKSPWLSLAFDSWALGVEASAVIGLRSLKLATGGKAAEVEARRMFDEKVAAAMELQMLALTGALGTTAHRAGARSVRHYAKKVRANRRRLTKADR
jgi:hypothetical protein